MFDDFLWVLVPRSPNCCLDLEYQTAAQLDSLRVVRDGGEEMPYDIDTPNGQLVPWGMTDNGGVADWCREPGDLSGSWTVVVNESRGPNCYAYDGPVAEFLLDVLARRVVIVILRDDFPSGMPTFRPTG